MENLNKINYQDLISVPLLTESEAKKLTPEQISDINGLIQSVHSDLIRINKILETVLE